GAFSSRSFESRERPELVRHHPGAVHRARPDLAADRHQPVRHPEHLGRQAVRYRLGHHPVPLADVRAAGDAGAVAGDRPLAAGAYGEGTMITTHATYPTGLRSTPTRHRALRERLARPGIVVPP